MTSDNTSKQNLETIVEAIRHLEGDHLFSEEAGPHQVVKEEVVEMCALEEGGQVVEMTLPSAVFSTTNIINSLPQVRTVLSWVALCICLVTQVPCSTYQLSLPGNLSLPLSASLPTVPVASMQQQSTIPVTVSNLVTHSSLLFCCCTVPPGLLAAADGRRGRVEPAARLHPGRPGPPLHPSRAWPHPAPADQPRQPGAATR